MAHFPAFKPLINDMIDNNIDREHFIAVYARVTFDVIITLDAVPHEILIGGRGINWACVMTISDDLEIIMPDNDFYSLRNSLELHANGIEKFGSYIFLKAISEQAPHISARVLVQPAVMQRWYPDRIRNADPEERTVFYRWVEQDQCGRQAHNFNKTEVYFGRNVADYCRRHNITSQWLTPEKAERMHIRVQAVNYPWA